LIGDAKQAEQKIREIKSGIIKYLHVIRIAMPYYISLPISIFLTISILLSTSISLQIAANERIQKGECSEKFAVFCLFITY
jgi:hypothetical protein